MLVQTHARLREDSQALPALACCSRFRPARFLQLSINSVRLRAKIFQLGGSYGTTFQHDNNLLIELSSLHISSACPFFYRASQIKFLSHGQVSHFALPAPDSHAP